MNENVVVSYGLMDYGYHQEAQELATRVLAVLADDLRNNKTWHEGYSAETGVRAVCRYLVIHTHRHTGTASLPSTLFMFALLRGGGWLAVGGTRSARIFVVEHSCS